MSTTPHERLLRPPPSLQRTSRHAYASTPLSARRSAHRPAATARKSQAVTASVAPKKILMLGGTRFIGVYVARMLIEQGHEVTLLTRGKSPVTAQIPDDTDEGYANYASAVKHIACDRKDPEAMKAALSGQGFQVVYDMNGREADEAEIVLEAIPDLEQYIFCSSAGVYMKSDTMPHREETTRSTLRPATRASSTRRSC